MSHASTFEWRRLHHQQRAADIDFDALYAFLSASYWSRGIPRETMERSIARLAALRAAR